MQINMTFKHMTASDAVREYATERSEKLKKYFDGRIHVRWNFIVEHGEPIAHCHVTGNHMDYFGEATAETMQAAIDDVIDKISRQVQKKKELVKDKLHKSA